MSNTKRSQFTILTCPSISHVTDHPHVIVINDDERPGSTRAWARVRMSSRHTLTSNLIAELLDVETRQLDHVNTGQPVVRVA